ncbi:MAG: hypothetical protein JRD68_14890 [Deltaproteobacteria bacterium]|nr:hypothetical protein [Deltaproteobacteria bacterium]
MFEKNDLDQKRLERGLNLFGEGDLAGASIIFERLSQNAEDEILRRKAVFGLAAARLNLATGLEEFNDALAVWKIWTSLIPAGLMEEDPRMLESLFQRIPPSRLAEISAREKSLKKEIEADQTVIKGQKKRIKALENKKSALEKQINTLRHKIESMESIDKAIDEKKRKITNL